MRQMRASDFQGKTVLRLLQRLRRKGKTGRTHTTPVENVYAHGVPDHRKAEAKELVSKLLRAGILAQKVSQGRQHVWITQRGLETRRWLEAEAAPASLERPTRRERLCRAVCSAAKTACSREPIPADAPQRKVSRAQTSRRSAGARTARRG